MEAAFAVFIPLTVRFFIDRGIVEHDPHALHLLLAILAGAATAAVSAGLLRDFAESRIQSQVLSRFRQSIFTRLQRVSMAFHSHARTADLFDKIAGDFAAIENAVSLAVPWGVLPLAQSLLSTGLIFWLNWHAGLATFLLWPWVMLAPRTAMRRLASLSDARLEEERGVMGAFRENLAGQGLIRAFSLENIGFAGFRKRNELFSKSMRLEGLWAAFQERFTGAGILGLQTFLLALDAWLTFQGQMSVGTLVAIQMVAVVLSHALLFIGEYLPSVSLARAAMQRIHFAIAAPEAVGDKDGARVLPAFQTELVFSHVDFSYDEQHRHLIDIKARIGRGSYVAFAGPSGSGKSTLLSLLMRFHDPDSGFIAIDGQDLKSLTQASLRSRMGVVLQENTLFNISVLENLRVGKPQASEEAVIDAAKRAGLHEFIEQLPEGYNTVAEDRVFSVVEMQRLAIARAILRDPEILLLDEATSGLDPVDEEDVGKRLREFAKGRTVISATHRLSTVADADHIFVLDRGEIAEQGSHDELLAKNGTYADCWRKQAGFTFSADGRHVDVDARRLKSFPILENLDEDKLAELAPFFATETYQPGRDIVRQNDAGDKFYIMARGKAEVWRTEEQTGQTQRLAVLQDGDFFGEITLITGFPRIATIRALTVCTCVSLGRGQFNKLMDRYPELRRHLHEEAVRRLRESSQATGSAVDLAI
ncbi:MAG: ATP-binding cassette domain-containing protein [Acidobacteriota bacterium]|nr:ATP-binding cassette domain-containing protein [Acidobacteriota bacterium]